MRDYVGIVKAIEGVYPKLLGTVTIGGIAQIGDERLRAQLTGRANDFLSEFEKQGTRWRKNFKTLLVQTVAAQTDYPVAASRWVHLDSVYWRQTTGRPVALENLDGPELRAVYGDGPNATPGQPRFYSIIGDLIRLYPTPDTSGPDAGGNFDIYIEYYAELPKIIETTGNTAASTTLTIPSSTYLIANGADPANTNLNSVTIRGAGALTGLTAPNQNDDFTTTWSAFGATTATLLAQPNTVVTGAQTFFNSRNWLLDSWPKVMLFGVLREAAGLLQADSDYAKWEARYQKELEDLMEWDQQSRHDREVLAGAVGGQRQPLLRGDDDIFGMFDVRGF